MKLERFITLLSVISFLLTLSLALFSKTEIIISSFSECSGINPGEKIVRIDGIDIKSLEDLKKIRCENGKEIIVITDSSVGKCKCINKTLPIKLKRLEKSYVKLSREFRREKYVLISDSSSIKVVENRLKVIGMDDYMTKEVNKTWVIEVPTWFVDEFENIVLKRDKLSFFFTKIIRKNSSIISELTGVPFVTYEINDSHSILEVKAFDINDLKELKISGSCSPQFAERCEITIIASPSTQKLYQFRNLSHILGVKIISLEKFINANFSIKIGNETILSTFVPYKIVKENFTRLIFIFPVKSSMFTNKVKLLKVYSGGEFKGKIIEKREELNMQFEIIEILIPTFLILLSLFLIKNDINKQVICIPLAISAIISSPYTYFLFFLSGILSLLKTGERPIKKLFLLILYPTALLAINQIFYFSLKNVLIITSIFFLTLAIKKYLKRFFAYSIFALILLLAFSYYFNFLTLLTFSFFLTFINWFPIFSKKGKM